MSAKPHLIHVGFPKCASTYLQDWFEAHPQILYRPGGIGGLHSIYHMVDDALDTSDTYKSRVTSAEQLVAPRHMVLDRGVEITKPENTRAATKRISAELHAMFPDAKILIITRNFRDIMLSGLSQIIRQGVALLDISLEQLNEPGLEMHNAYDFDRTIDIFRTDFGDNVIVLPFELLVDDRRAFLSIIETAITVDQFDLGAKKSNPSLSSDEMYWYPRFARVMEILPSARARALLRKFHSMMIASGVWQPLLCLLKLIFGKRAPDFTFIDEAVRVLHGQADRLIQSELYTPYRKGYGGD